MSSIRKRTWTSPAGETKTAWLVDYRDQMENRRHKQFARKKDAEQWLTQAAWEVSKGVHTADSVSVTVAAAADLWIARAEQNERERGTVESYKMLSRLHIKPLIGAEKLSRLSQPKVEAFKDLLLETRSKATTAKAVRALSSILSEAQRRGLVAQNVARGVKVIRSKRDRPEVEIPAKAELRAMLDLASDKFKPLLMTAIFTGLRASELRGMRWRDVDFKAATVSVSQRADKFGQIGPPKSEAGYRTIPIPPALVTELKGWKLACPVGDLGLLFPNTRGGVQDYGHLLRRRFFPLQVEAGVVDDQSKARYGLHALRHAAASAWIKQRIDLKRLQVWMGHASVQITLDTYGHLLLDASGDADLMAKAQAELLS